MNVDECPCEKCLVRAVCKTRMCEKDHLIVDYIRTCPLALEYISDAEQPDQLCRMYFHKKINLVCDYLGVEDRNWVWRANEVGVY
jgi:hypothetical protein